MEPRAIAGSDENELMLVESYRPSDDATTVLSGFRPDVEGGGGTPVQVMGAVVVPADEVVFYLVRAASVSAVRELFERLGIGSVRIVPAAWVAAAQLGEDPA